MEPISLQSSSEGQQEVNEKISAFGGVVDRNVTQQKAPLCLGRGFGGARRRTDIDIRVPGSSARDVSQKSINAPIFTLPQGIFMFDFSGPQISLKYKSTCKRSSLQWHKAAFCHSTQEGKGSMQEHSEASQRCCSEVRPAERPVAASHPVWPLHWTNPWYVHCSCSSIFTFVTSSRSCHVLMRVIGPSA